jgi:hypothetical protein
MNASVSEFHGHDQALQGSCIFNAVRLGLELPELSLKNDAPFAVFRSIPRLPVI